MFMNVWFVVSDHFADRSDSLAVARAREDQGKDDVGHRAKMGREGACESGKT